MASKEKKQKTNESLAKELCEKACTAIDNLSDELYKLSTKLWCNPELNFEEHFAHETVTTFLEGHGFDVRKKYPLETAFVASNKSTKQGNGPCVAILCEYDALPQIGHACGHNLIAEAGVAAAIGVKAALDHDGTNTLGHLVVMGTPAEEGGGGKILMLDAGCFDNVDFSMMVHPEPHNTISSSLANRKVFVTFKGRSAHAAAFPWEGKNALDAAVLSYNAISMLRQQMKPTWRAHGVFTNGGFEPSIIPETTQLHYFFRCPTLKEVEVLREKADHCFRSAAKATGCSVEINWYGFGESQKPYANLVQNPVLSDLYIKHAESLGVTFPPKSVQETLVLGSTDMGNVSHTIPSIHPSYEIIADAGNHTHEFTKATGGLEAQHPTLVAAKSMAMTTIDVLCKRELLEKMKKTFEGCNNLHNLE